MLRLDIEIVQRLRDNISKAQDCELNLNVKIEKQTEIWSDILWRHLSKTSSRHLVENLDPNPEW